MRPVAATSDDPGASEDQIALYAEGSGPRMVAMRMVSEAVDMPWGHAQVNAELTRLTGLRKVTEATVEQLERRLRHAERWYRRA